MKRTLLALALFSLLLPGAANAATITYDLAETSTYLEGGLETILRPGSTLTLELDANGDGLEGDPTIAGSLMQIELESAQLAGTPLAFTITENLELEIWGGGGFRFGGPGQYSEEGIDWSLPAQYAISGTFRCEGPGCALVGLLDGAEVPYGPPFVNIETVGELQLGVWIFEGGPSAEFFSGCTDHYGACFQPMAIAMVAGTWANALLLHGRAVPEPKLLLPLLPLAFVLLRRRFA
jgi:hypothetical protein